MKALLLLAILATGCNRVKVSPEVTFDAEHIAKKYCTNFGGVDYYILEERDNTITLPNKLDIKCLSGVYITSESLVE